MAVVQEDANVGVFLCVGGAGSKVGDAVAIEVSDSEIEGEEAGINRDRSGEIATSEVEQDGSGVAAVNDQIHSAIVVEVGRLDMCLAERQRKRFGNKTGLSKGADRAEARQKRKETKECHRSDSLFPGNRIASAAIGTSSTHACCPI